MNKVFEKGRIVNKPEYSQNYIQICPLEIHQRQAICNMTLEQNNYRTYHEFFNFTLRGENDVGTNVQSFWINNYESGKFYKGECHNLPTEYCFNYTIPFFQLYRPDRNTPLKK